MEKSDLAVELHSKVRKVSESNSAQTIYDKVSLAKQTGNTTETINTLEEIINDLIADKNELTQITESYSREFRDQSLSDADFDYITGVLLPIIISFVPIDKDNAFFPSVEKLLSKETLKILQLLGFNYKEAIGLPLTNIVAQAIQSQTNKFTPAKGSSHRDE